MTEPILSLDYWQRRLEQARAAGQLHTAVFRCPLERWQRIEAKHREILARLIGSGDAVLDCGCGYGRLLDLMPAHWDASEEGGGNYLGVDLSPDLIALAKRLHPGRVFFVGDLRKLPVEVTYQSYDVAILISIRPMVRRNCGDDVWHEMETELRRVAKKLLYLEYDPDAEESVE